MRRTSVFAGGKNLGLPGIHFRAGKIEHGAPERPRGLLGPRWEHLNKLIDLYDK